MTNKKLIAAAIVLFLGVVLLFGVFHWTVNRVYVPEGQSLLLEYKGPLLFGSREKAKPGHFAEPGQIGVLEQLRGPGRHFYCPIWWKTTLINDIVIEPGHVGVVTSKLGEELPKGQYVVDAGLDTPRNKGILRNVLPPGRYRVNTYAFEVDIIQTKIDTVDNQQKHSGWVEIPAGYVGVVTYRTANTAAGKTAGIQSEVLPPGIYPTNPQEQRIDIVEIGYTETSVTVEKVRDRAGQVVYDDDGEPLAREETGIWFPSEDALDIQLDFTAIWGVMPAQAPAVVDNFGNIREVEQRIVEPQSKSICRNLGSTMGAVELLVGDSRQEFQDEVSVAFSNVLQEKDVTLLYGLVRHIYIPLEIRQVIQEGYIANELTLTRTEEQNTAKMEATFREAEQKVLLEAEKIAVDTAKQVAAIIADGEKQSKEIAAETEQLVAAIDKQIAELEAQKTVKLGEATAKAQQLQEEAKAQKFQLAVEAFGTGDAYNKWEFAEGLPPQIDLQLFYAGEGTLWTDLKSAVPTVPLRPQK